jgi:hypothetical protein
MILETRGAQASRADAVPEHSDGRRPRRLCNLNFWQPVNDIIKYAEEASLDPVPVLSPETWQAVKERMGQY